MKTYTLPFQKEVDGLTVKLYKGLDGDYHVTREDSEQVHDHEIFDDFDKAKAFFDSLAENKPYSFDDRSLPKSTLSKEREKEIDSMMEKMLPEARQRLKEQLSKQSKSQRKSANRMYYMKVANRHNNFTRGYEIRAYESRADRQKALDYLWENGSNGMFCSRTEVEQDYGKDFDVYKDDEHGELYTHLDPFCQGIVDTEFYKNVRSFS